MQEGVEGFGQQKLHLKRFCKLVKLLSITHKIETYAYVRLLKTVFLYLYEHVTQK